MEQEKIGKIFMLIVALLFFGSTYYYYGHLNVKRSSNLHSSAAQSPLTKQASTPAAQIAAKIEKPANKITADEQSVETDKTTPSAKAVYEDKNTKETKTAVATAKKISPTGKSAFTKMLADNSGKNDPFSYSESHFMPFDGAQPESSSPLSSLPGNLPPVPSAGNVANLPALPGAPSIAGMNSLPSPPSPEDSVRIKGFIGNKVIAEVNGEVLALDRNEKFNNIRVVSINPEELKAGFEIDGKTITKTLKSLTDENNENIQLIKNYQN